MKRGWRTPGPWCALADVSSSVEGYVGIGADWLVHDSAMGKSRLPLRLWTPCAWPAGTLIFLGTEIMAERMLGSCRLFRENRRFLGKIYWSRLNSLSYGGVYVFYLFFYLLIAALLLYELIFAFIGLEEFTERHVSLVCFFVCFCLFCRCDPLVEGRMNGPECLGLVGTLQGRI